MERTRIAFVGVGNISGIYLKNLTTTFANEVEIAGVCDLIPERAQKAADEYGVHIYPTYDDILADESVEIILNITRPNEHFDITMAGLKAGKHVYSEKPLATEFEQGKLLVAYAREHQLMLGGAPDTFLGGGIQTCRKLIDDGYIGEPVYANAVLLGCGHEIWHPGPEFYYERGGGPMLDMGPYYVTALVNLLGPAASVMGRAKITYPQRVITSQPNYGKVIDVEVPTHYNGIIDFKNGCTGSIVTSFDVQYGRKGRYIEVLGSEGTLRVPDPNDFGGKIGLLRAGESEFTEIPIVRPYTENSRGLGLADMAHALRSGRRHRANCDQTCHVLEIMTSFEKSSRENRTIQLETTFERGAPMKYTKLLGILDD